MSLEPIIVVKEPIKYSGGDLAPVVAAKSLHAAAEAKPCVDKVVERLACLKFDHVIASK